MLCLELSSLLSIYSITLNNHRFKIPSIVSVIIFSCGCFLLAIYEINKNLILEILSFAPKIAVYNNLINDVFLLITLLMIIGFIPFIEWNMYIFSISSSLFKIITFITPMFLSLQVMQELNTKLLFNSYQIIGLIICAYSCFCITINNNIRLILMYVLTYFYGTRTMFMASAHVYNYAFEQWLIVCFCVLLLSNTLTPNRIIKYKLQDIRYILKHWFYVVLFVFSLAIILYCFVDSFLIAPINNEHIKIAQASLFTVFFAKLLANSVKKENKTTVLAKEDLSKYRMMRMTIGNILLSGLCILHTHRLLSIHHKPNIFLLSSSLIFFLIFLSVLLLFGDFFQLKNTKNKTYSNIIMVFIKFVKIASLIIQSVIIDFTKTIKEEILKLTISSVPQKLSNMLYGQHVYFYIFFLIQAIVVLIIECVIL